MSALALNPRRLGLLMRNDIAGARTPAIMLATAAGVSFVLYFLTSIGGGSPVFHQVVFPITLTVLGSILASFSFTEIHETRTGAFILTSPGSLLEKYVTKVLLTSVGWTIAVTVVYTIVTLAGAGLAQWLLRSSHGIFLPTGRWVWQTIAAYLVSQSVFVLGSIYFKKAAFLKTLLAATLTVIGFGIFFMVAWRVVYWGAFSRLFPSEAEMNAVMNVESPAAEQLYAIALRVVDIARWTFVPVLAWVAGFLRLRETEV